MRFRDSHDDPDDDLEDDESHDEADMDGSDEPEFVPCPECGKAISEDAERCHHCGYYITAQHTHRRVPLWVVVTTAIAILIVLMWIF